MRKRKQLEKALQLNQGRWQLALEASQDGVWDWDIENEEVYYSPSWEEMFGFQPGEAPQTQETFTSLVHPDELDGVIEEIRRCLRKEIPFYKKEIRMIHRNGTPMWTLRSASVIFNEAGKPVRMIGTTVDITERKNAETALLLSENRLKLQIERMPIGLIVWTTDFKALSWNPSAESIFGYTEQEMLGKHPYGYIVPAEAQPIVDTVWQRLVEGDTTAHSINDNMTKDGRIIAHVGSWDFDLATGDLIWSKEMFRLFEMENHPPETLYETFRSKVHPEDLAKLDLFIQRTIEQGEPYMIEERVALQDGTTRYLSCIGEPVKNAAGDIIGLRGTS